MYLASKSPQRKALLESLDLDFEIVLPEYEEIDPPGLSPAELVERHSLGKAQSVLAKVKPLSAGRPVLGVDTMVVVDGEALGKAADEEQATVYLRRLSGKVHHVYSGLSLLWVEGKDGPVIEITGHAVTDVRFEQISDADLDWYVATGEWRGRAGAYAIQERGSAFVKEIRGDYTNVVGLPVPLLISSLRNTGLWPPRRS